MEQHGDTLVIDDLLRRHLSVLDSWQSEVDNIRMMHHQIWKESRVYQVIKQHRAGSRVERHTRILPQGQKTDVDYKFEVVGVNISCDVPGGGLFWVPSGDSPAYGKVYVTTQRKTELTSSEAYRAIFTEDAFRWSEEQHAYLLLPGIFKENVVVMSGFAYARKENQSVVSPSMPGDGAMNEYDIVPCIQMSQWPKSTLTWFERGHNSGILNPQWKQTIKVQPLYLVATGNPLSPDFEEEFRLSFSLIEVLTFRHVPDYARQLYGFAKYIFKMKLEKEHLLDSYHLKTLFLWILESSSLEVLVKMSPLQFASLIFEKVENAVKDKEIPHFYVEKCNIFPFHKISENDSTKVENYKSILGQLSARTKELAEILLKTDLKLNKDPCEHSSCFIDGLSAIAEGQQKTDYIDAYLVRLLSVTTFSLYENVQQGTLQSAVSRITDVFADFTKRDDHIHRIIPMVNATLEHLQLSSHLPRSLIRSSQPENEGDRVSILVHQAFEAYVRKLPKAIDLAREAISLGSVTFPSGFGISVTSYHKQFELDEPLCFVIRTLETRSSNGKCPRFYVDPLLLSHHILIQTGTCNVQSALSKMEEITEKLPDHVPYKGKLSYKFTAVYLLHGYKNSSWSENTDVCLTLPTKYSLDHFQSKGMLATNFEMR